MSSRYDRPLSPPRNRYHPPAGRTSASSFFTGSGYDPYAAPTRTSRDYVPGPLLSDERVAAPRLLPPRTRSPPRRAAVDDYHVPLRTQPRRGTLELEDTRNRRPLSMIIPTSPARTSRPVITSAIDRPPSPTPKVRRDHRDDDYEVQPASSSSRRHHQRHSSLNTTDPGRLAAVDRDRDFRDTTYRVSSTSKPPVRERLGESDRDYGFEYTEAREPKMQDPIYRQRSRKDSYDTSRPKSMIAPDAYVPRAERGAGPPVTSRGFENLGRSESQRQGYRARDDERIPKEVPRDDRVPRDPIREDRVLREPVRDDRDRRSARSEIALHQPTKDYAHYPEEESRHHHARKPTIEDERLEPRTRPRKVLSEEDRLDPRARDIRDDPLDRGTDDHPRAHRHRHKHHHHRDHDSHEDESEKDRDRRERRERRAREEPRDKRDRGDRGDDVGPSSGMLGGAAAATAGAGLAAEEIRRHRHKDREPREEVDFRPARIPLDHLREPDRDHLETSSVSTSLSISEREDLEYQEAREAERRAREQAELFTPRPVEQEIREQKSWERRPEDEAPRHHRTYRPRRHHHHTHDEDSWSEPSSSSSSDSDSEDDRISRPPPRVVTPANEEKPEPKPAPKGILRKPREQFPEYPATFREGAAPHKDDKKKDVPRNARWTKIDRRLVNPEALEQDGIRFNEFVDHVIVLKVMDKEEIEKYTRKTAEIREKRRMLMEPEGVPPPPQQIEPAY